MSLLSFYERSLLCSNPTAQKLFQLMDKKQTNLSISLDVTRSADLIKLTELLGPYICVLKTHIDIVEDFSSNLITELKHLAEKHNFLIFEDRKFADIGNTVRLQYSSGIYHISDWAHITNAHPLPGPGIIEGLSSIGLKKGNGLLLLAQMSSQGNMINSEYTQAAVKMAEDHSDFVIGFVAQQHLSDNPRFIHFTPGVNLTNQNDNLGQQYTTPEDAILNHGTDIIIVGRGIYSASDPETIARQYRDIGWDSYKQRTAK